MKILYGTIAAGILWGIVILIRETIRGFRLTATKRSVIICTVIYGVLGPLNTVLGIIGTTMGSGSSPLALFIGLSGLVLAVGLVWKNFVKKGVQSGKTESNVSSAEPETKEPPVTNENWVCPNCGKENYGYARSCRCGEKKPE